MKTSVIRRAVIVTAMALALAAPAVAPASAAAAPRGPMVSDPHVALTATCGTSSITMYPDSYFGGSSLTFCNGNSDFWQLAGPCWHFPNSWNWDNCVSSYKATNMTYGRICVVFYARANYGGGAASILMLDPKTTRYVIYLMDNNDMFSSVSSMNC